jgi:predicted deacylase
MKNFTIGAFSISAGSQQTVDLPISVLANRTPISLPVHVIHGSREGPVFFISGVVHGDEILGVEIIRRVVGHHALKDLAGTLLAVPIVNTFGFLNHSRYMPDRRDLNRSFPGSDRGSLASLLADLFMKEVVLRAQYGANSHRARATGALEPCQKICGPGGTDFKTSRWHAAQLREGQGRQRAAL